MLGRALTGLMTGALMAVVVWIAVFLKQEGLSRTREPVAEMDPIADVVNLSSQWLLKTGALPGGVLWAIGAPYLGPIVGGLIWQSIAGMGGPVPVIDLSYVGSVVVGVVAGLLGYLLRVP